MAPQSVSRSVDEKREKDLIEHTQARAQAPLPPGQQGRRHHGVSGVLPHISPDCFCVPTKYTTTNHLHQAFFLGGEKGVTYIA